MVTKTFDVWMETVNSYLRKTVGLSADDLPDCLYRDWYDEGMTPSRAAKEAVRNAKEY